jgi:lysophospholipid acyltransferase (LPLAT)-like uncharacterized protein
MTAPTQRGRLRDLANRVMSQATAFAAATLLWAVSRTWRIDATCLRDVDALISKGVPVIVVFWHGQYLSMVPVAQGRKVVALTSGTGRGPVLAQVCRSFGYTTVSVGGTGGKLGQMGPAHAALQTALSTKPAPLAAIAADGPLGPARRIKPGVLMLASMLGYAIVPLSARVSGKIVLARRWDRMEVPLPFARVRLRLGPVFQLASPLHRADLLAACQQVTAALTQISAPPLVHQADQCALFAIRQDGMHHHADREIFDPRPASRPRNQSCRH